MAKPELKKEAIRLRVEERLSFTEIERRLKVSKGTLGNWLRDHPLRVEELALRRTENGNRLNLSLRPRFDAAKLAEIKKRSKFYDAVSAQKLTRSRKSKIAEAAVLFRLVLFGFEVSGPVFDCARQDWFVHAEGAGGTAKIQVKWARRSKGSKKPFIELVCRDYAHKENKHGTRRYRPGEFDFIVGYDLFTDTAYVYSEEDVAGREWCFTIREDGAERWDKVAAKIGLIQVPVAQEIEHRVPTPGVAGASPAGNIKKAPTL